MNSTVSLEQFYTFIYHYIYHSFAQDWVPSGVPSGSASGTSDVGEYLTLYPSSRPNTDTINLAFLKYIIGQRLLKRMKVRNDKFEAFISYSISHRGQTEYVKRRGTALGIYCISGLS